MDRDEIELRLENVQSPERIEFRRVGEAQTCASGLSDDCFTDLTLSRVLEIRGSLESQTAAADNDWHSEITLEIGAYPKIGAYPNMCERRSKVVALDHGMQGGKATIKVRRALLYYALRRLGLDTEPDARKPQDQQIVLIGQEAVS